MNPVILEQLNSFDIDDYRPIVPRDLDLGDALPPKKGNLVKVVTGMRRSGKSYRLLQEMERLAAQGVPWDRMCYFSFEDDRLYPVTSATGDEVLEAFFSRSPEALREGCYLFFDEVQEMDGWGAWLRRVVDTTKATLYVTGSSSKMLSADISTEFRGRAIDFELLPYSFGEWLRASGYALPAMGFVSMRERIELQERFVRYLDEGGFPATVGLPRPQAVSLLQGYVQRVVARDVVERHDVARPRVASVFTQRVLSTNAKELSVRKIEGALRSMGLSSSRVLLGDLLGYLRDAYLIFSVLPFSYALSESVRGSGKVYAIDPGLACANARANSVELGQRLENAVYLELRRRSPHMRKDGVSSYKTKASGYEVDFVCGDVVFQQALELYQVSVNVDDERTRARELRSLWEAMAESGLDAATLVVLEGEDAMYERDGMRVVQVPAWKWFLQEG